MVKWKSIKKEKRSFRIKLVENLKEMLDNINDPGKESLGALSGKRKTGSGKKTGAEIETRAKKEAEPRDDISELIRANRQLEKSNEMLQAMIIEHRRIEELLLLQRDLAAALISANSIKEALGQIFDAALRIDGIDGGAVYLADEEGGVNMVHHKGLSDRFVKGCSYCGPDSLRAKIVKAGKWVYRDRSYIDSSPFNDLRVEGFRSIADFPVKYNDRPIAAIILVSRTFDDFPQSARMALEALAASTAGIIARIKAEEAMKESERRYRELAELLPQTVFEVDAQGDIIFANSFGLTTFGYTPEDLKKGLHVIEVMAFKERNRIIEDFSPQAIPPSQTVQTQPLQSSEEYLMLRKDGSTFPGMVYATRIERDGKFVGWRGIITDITRRKESEEALRQAKEAAEEAARAKTEFLANMSHEIRTPMNAVIGMTGLLLDSNLDFEQQECVEIIKSSGDALLATINDILDFSKIEAGRMELEKKDIRLQSFLENCLDLLAGNAREKGLKLHYQIDGFVPDSINSDPTRMRQILINFLSNAVKFTEEGEVVVIVSSEAINESMGEMSNKSHAVRRIHLHFAVQDTGIGIPPERMNRLFQSFSQVDMSTTRKYGGTGLGLAISKKLVDIMGGRIWVESELGKGSTFHFSVPVDVAPASSPGSKEASSPYLCPPLYQAQERREGDSPGGIYGELCILIAEDNEVNKRVIKKMLRKLGFQADIANDGQDVLTALEKQRYDLILMDVQMPRMDGLEAASLIRKRWPLSEQPCIIALTACALEGDRDRCLDAGMDGYISKPVKMEDLREALRKCEIRRVQNEVKNE
ncbi:MAG: response regulator [Methanotrichaceae archaeon]|nr:response regulator [Methanotrichaceae archaeon]